MQYRRLGRTGIVISEIGFGSWLTVSRSVDAEKTKALVAAAWDLGINFYDTADVYNTGGAEEMLGSALQAYPRSKFVLATKCFFPMSNDVNDRGLSRKHIFESVHASLKRLKTDYIDLYQCHRYDDATPLAETCHAMHDLVTQGKILYWGVSQWSAVQITEATGYCRVNGLHGPVSNQPIYNMINRSLEAEVMGVCDKRGLGIVVYSPLAQGILTGKYSGGAKPAGSRASDEVSLNYMSQKYMTPEWLARVDALKPIAEKNGLSMAQLALAWCLRRREITCTIIGATKIEQLKDNAGASGKRLSAEDLAKIDEIIATYPVDQYTGRRLS
ncbi:MAG TPA: aldo/keto reductase family protein [Candidatus Kapabacteria bacterium]|nr:aldo/keto reductase family protein [Candidatus Kapabacteria bacterium]